MMSSTSDGDHHEPWAITREERNRAQVGDDEVYDFLLERNRLDIELYEWSKTISLVNCATL